MAEVDEINTKEEEQKIRAEAIKDTFNVEVNPEEIGISLEISEDVDVDKEQDVTVNIDKEETDEDPSKDVDIKDSEKEKTNVKTDKFDKILNAVQTLNQTVSGMEGRLKQSERRIGGITNELSAAKKAAEEQDDAPTEKQMKEAAKTEKSWEDLKENFPDWADAIEGRLNSITQNIVSKDDLSALRRELIEKESSIESYDKVNDPNSVSPVEVKLVTLFHPGWEETVKTDDFINWIKAQPVDVMNKYAYSTDAVDAIDVLNRYNNSIKKEPNNDEENVIAIKDARSKRLSESVLDKKKHQTIKPKAESDMTQEELWEHISAKVFGKEK